MVARIAEVEFVVDSSQLERAKNQVNQLNSAGQNLSKRNDTLGRSFKEAASRAASLGKQLGRIGAIAGGSAAGGLAVIVQQNLQAIDRFDQLNQRLGISVEALSELQFVAKQNGVQFDTLADSLQTLQERTAEATEGTGEAAEAFDRLGLNAERLINVPLERRLEIVAEALSQVDNQAERTRAAIQIFGDQGVALLQVMQNGADGIQQFRDRAEELGLTLSNLDAQAVARANDSITEFTSVLTAVGRQITVALAPVIKDLSNYLRNQFVNNMDQVREIVRDTADIMEDLAQVAVTLAQNIEIVTTAMGALAGLRVGAALGPWGAAVGVLAGALGGRLLPELIETESATQRQIEASKQLSKELDRGADMSDETAKASLEEAIARREAAKATLEQVRASIEHNQTVTEGMQRPGANVAREQKERAKELEEQIRRSTENIEQLRERLRDGGETDSGATEITIKKPGIPRPETKPDAIRQEAQAIRERIRALELNAEQEQRLLEAQRQGQEELRKAKVLIQAENEARRLGVQLGSEKHQQIIEAVRAEQQAAKQREQIVERQRQAEERRREQQREAEQERREQMREREALMRRGEQLQEQLMTSEERRAARLQELNNLLNKGAISQETYNRAVQRLNERLLEQSTTAQAGFIRGIRQVREEMNDLGSLTENLVVNSFRTLEDTIVQAFTTGRFEADKFFQQVLADITRLAVRAAIIRPLFSFFGFSQGGVPNVTGFDQGGVVSQPTVFPMAQGDIGVMSEFGQKEAIMPLERTSNGDLGVRANLDTKTQSNQTVNVQPNLNLRIDATNSVISNVDDFKTEIAQATGAFVSESIVNELRQGGYLDRG